MLNIDVYLLTKCLILYLLEYVSGLSSNDEIINLSGLASNNIPVTPTTDAIIDVNGSTTNLDSETVPEELSKYHNNFKIKEYIDSVCMDMFVPWEPKLLIDVFILSQKYKDYNIIKHINEEIFYIVYFNPSKYSVKDKYDGDVYSLLCNNIDGYHIIRNGYYTICGSTAQRFS